MAAHRYWRIRFGPIGGGFFNVAELSFMDRNFVRILGGGPIGSFSFPGFPEANAFDGNLATIWSSATGVPVHFLGYDFGVPRDIAFVRCTREQNNNSFTYSYQVDFSDDGLAWTYTGYENPPAIGGSNAAVVIPTQNFTNIFNIVSNKWTILLLAPQSPADNQLISVAEVAFTRATIDQTFGGVVTGSLPSFIPANAPPAAFDKNPNTLYVPNSNNAYPYFLSYFFAQPVGIDGVELTARNDGFELGNIKHAVIQAFDALTEVDVSVYAIFNEPPWVSGEKRIFNFVESVIVTRREISVDTGVSAFNGLPYSSYFIFED